MTGMREKPQQVFEYLTKPQGPVLQRFSKDRSRCTFIRGPLGSGKTIQTCQKVFDLMCEQEANSEGVRATRWCAVRNTYSDLETTTIADWLEMYGDLGKFTAGHPPVHRLRFQLEDETIVEAELIFLALDRIDSVKKLRGMQVTGFWLNETKELAKAIVDMADLRHGRYPSMVHGGSKPSWHGMIGDTNAPDEDHWYYRLAEEDTPEGWVFYTQPGGLIRTTSGQWLPNEEAENLSNLPPGYYTRGMQGKDEDWIKVNLANEYGFVMDGKPVYPEYVDSVHYVPDMKYSVGSPIILGMDFGLTPACAFLQKQAGSWCVIDEFSTDDADAVTMAKEVLRMLSRDYPECEVRGWGDPAGDQRSPINKADTVFRALRDLGLPIAKSPDVSNDPSVRRLSVREPLRSLGPHGAPRLLVGPKCKRLRKGLAGGFRYKRVQVSGDERFMDKPDKNIYSHICEALEYGLVGEGEGEVMPSEAAIQHRENYVHRIKVKRAL